MTVPAEAAAKANRKKPQNGGADGRINGHLARLSLAALGVVFGDIGTSPIYALRECFHGEYGIEITHANVMGVLSLVFWALVMIVGLKYLIFVFIFLSRNAASPIAFFNLPADQVIEIGVRMEI